MIAAIGVFVEMLSIDKNVGSVPSRAQLKAILQKKNRDL